MVTERNNLFRKEALERSASPEQLDQIMQVVSPKKWIPLVALGSLVAGGLAWSILGRIPITVSGQGALVFPSQVVDFQSPSPGQLQTINVRVGDFVKKGQVLATINQGELQKQLQLGRGKLAQLQSQDRNASSLLGQRQDLDRIAIAQQRQSLLQSLQTVQSLTPILRDKGLVSIGRDRTSLQQRLQTTRELLPTFKKRWDNRLRLLKEGAVSDDTVLKARQEYLDSMAQIDEAESQLKQLDVKEADAQRQFLQNLNSIKDLQTQLKELDSKQASQAQQDLEGATGRKKEMQEVERNIAQLELQLKGKSQIISNRNGRILEITATPGQILGQGTRLGSIAAQDSSAKLVSVAFLPVSDGKKIQKGMKLQITPTTVKREQFGGILGTVADVSAFPVTKEGASSLVGNPELLQNLMSQGPQLAVFAELQPDTSTFSGFRWSSSKGPQMKMSSGTTTSVRVTVEEQAPITFVLPILKSWSGIY
jgi:HlyD family secretion protein